MNFTLLHLNVKNNLEFSPLLSLKNNITLSCSKFTQFICPCIISPTQLKIHHTSFSRFLSQIITSSHSFLNKDALISCSSFRDITTSSKGSIFSYSNAHVHIDRCSFINVISTSFPACFYVENSTTIVTRCTFSSCHAIGGESCYGNAYYCYRCSNTLFLSYTEKCSNSYDETGDSTIALLSSTFIHAENINSTSSYGHDGAASITCRDSSCDNIEMSYLTITNPCEHNAIELADTKTTKISHANIINGNMCSSVMILNVRCEFVTIIHSVFINPHWKIAYDPSKIEYNECYSNNRTICASCIECDINFHAEMNLIFYQHPQCSKNTNFLKYKIIFRNSLTIPLLSIFRYQISE